MFDRKDIQIMFRCFPQMYYSFSFVILSDLVEDLKIDT